MLRAKQAFQKGPYSDERPERWGTWDRCVRPSVCMFVCSVALRENAGDPKLMHLEIGVDGLSVVQSG